jgi:hypothetical protein
VRQIGRRCPACRTALLNLNSAVEAESACWRSPLRGAEASTAEFRLKWIHSRKRHRPLRGPAAPDHPVCHVLRYKGGSTDAVGRHKPAYPLVIASMGTAGRRMNVAMAECANIDSDRSCLRRFCWRRCSRLCQGFVVARPKGRTSPKLEERRRAVTAKGCAALTELRISPSQMAPAIWIAARRTKSDGLLARRCGRLIF